MGWELNVGPLWESQTFLATEPSLQTPLTGCQQKEWKHSYAFLSYSSQGVPAVKTVCHIRTHSRLRPTPGSVHPTDNSNKTSQHHQQQQRTSWYPNRTKASFSPQQNGSGLTLHWTKSYTLRFILWRNSVQFTQSSNHSEVSLKFPHW